MEKVMKAAVSGLGVCLWFATGAMQPAGAQQPSNAQQPAATQSATTQPATQTPAKPTPPPPPQPVTVKPGYFNGADSWSITLQEWLAVGHPAMGTGHLDTNDEPTSFTYGGKPRPIPGAILTIPIGKQHHHSFHFCYFRAQGVGNPTLANNEIIFGTNYYAGDYLAVHYTMQNAKLSFDYLSWPFPVKDSKFHFKTLYEIQYTTISTSVDAPLRHGTTDASGNAINTIGVGTDWFIYPSFGIGADYLFNRKFRFEGRASGFIFPHRSTIWDADASLNYRFGKLELQGGVKSFHFKTSPERNEFVLATYPGVYVGLRWYPSYTSR